MTERDSRVLLIGIARSLQTQYFSFEVARRAYFRARNQYHRSVAREAPKHNDVAVLHRNWNREKSRHDRKVDFVSYERHRRNVPRGSHNVSIESFLGKQARFFCNV